MSGCFCFQRGKRKNQNTPNTNTPNTPTISIDEEQSGKFNVQNQNRHGKSPKRNKSGMISFNSKRGQHRMEENPLRATSAKSQDDSFVDQNEENTRILLVKQGSAVSLFAGSDTDDGRIRRSPTNRSPPKTYPRLTPSNKQNSSASLRLDPGPNAVVLPLVEWSNFVESAVNKSTQSNDTPTPNRPNSRNNDDNHHIAIGNETYSTTMTNSTFNPDTHSNRDNNNNNSDNNNNNNNNLQNTDVKTTKPGVMDFMTSPMNRQTSQKNHSIHVGSQVKLQLNPLTDHEPQTSRTNIFAEADSNTAANTPALLESVELLANDSSGFGLIFSGCKSKQDGNQNGYGVFISDIKPGSVASRNRLIARGLQIRSANGVDLSSATLPDLKAALKIGGKRLQLSLCENEELVRCFSQLYESQHTRTPWDYTSTGSTLEVQLTKTEIGFGVSFTGAKNRMDAAVFGYGIFVDKVKYGSPAAKKSVLTPGVQVVALNKVDLANATLKDVRDLVRSSTTTLTLKLQKRHLIQEVTLM